jgi:hypothetical protein
MSSSAHIPKIIKPVESKDQPYLDYGPKLPDRYGIAAIRALVRDPRTIFTYWEWIGTRSGFAVQLRDLTMGNFVNFEVASSSGSRYYDVPSDHEFEVAFGTIEKGAFVQLMASNRVKTPRENPATEADAEMTEAERDLWRSLGGDRTILPAAKFGYARPPHA